MKKLISALAIAVLLVPFASSAQWTNNFPTFLKNYEIGYGYPVTWAKYTRTDHLIKDGAAHDTTINLNVKSKSSFGAAIGTYFPLKQLGQKSKLCLAVGFMYNLYTWDYPTYALSSYNNGFDYNSSIAFGGATLHVGVPLGLDIKIGCDGMMEKTIRWGWTAGAGVVPSVNLTADLDNADAQIGVQPYVKSEVALFAGICWKLRVMYSVGNLTYIDVDGKNSLFSDGTSATKLIGKGNLTTSLIIMPFSWMWKKSAWYNRY